MKPFHVEMRTAALTALLAAVGTAQAARAADHAMPDRAAPDRTSIAVFRDWGAFREGPANAPARCFAIAAPPPSTIAAGRGAFAAVAYWPGRRIRTQLSIHLSYALRDGEPVTLAIGDAAFALIGHGQQAWAHDRHQDARIVAAMRSGSSMSISGIGADGHPFADVYRLRGAASAIDAAALACPMR
ncbi:hypothetical protein [Sphingomonas abietis]|uniref:Uncharacterized protein n=1 Tax=Sphingomonas abietis TaxID=3012344 RepID=A0ABY7NMG4_9SPHN|nr:hypothetical protein [Sphingomonas abietis]WBO22705.1 hypothetical protein PBT88_00685 [Sphingomonas abietis]